MRQNVPTRCLSQCVPLTIASDVCELHSMTILSIICFHFILTGVTDVSSV